MIPKEVTTEAVLREVSIDPGKKNKENLLEKYRGWTWLGLLGCDNTLLQPDEGPLHHGHGSLADGDDEAGPAVLCKKYQVSMYCFPLIRSDTILPRFNLASQARYLATITIMDLTCLDRIMDFTCLNTNKYFSMVAAGTRELCWGFSGICFEGFGKF